MALSCTVYIIFILLSFYFAYVSGASEALYKIYLAASHIPQ